MVKYSQDSRRIGIPVEIHGTNQKRCENKTSNRMPNEKKNNFRRINFTWREIIRRSFKSLFSR